MFEENGSSFRQIGSALGVSHTAAAKRAKRDEWKRYAAVETPKRKPNCKPPDAPISAPIQIEPVGLSATVKDLTARGRNIILALMAELEYLNQNASILMELVDANFNGDKDAATRAKLMKALDHEVRTKSSNQLATALAKLQDAAPGKKEQAEEDAKTAGAGTAWDDLDSAPASMN